MKICPKINENLSQNQWKFVPKSMKICPKINENLSQNQWKFVPKSMKNCPKINENLSQNQWKFVPKSMKICPKITENLSQKFVPKSMKICPKITENLSQKSVQKINENLATSHYNFFQESLKNCLILIKFTQVFKILLISKFVTKILKFSPKTDTITISKNCQSKSFKIKNFISVDSYDKMLSTQKFNMKHTLHVMAKKRHSPTFVPRKKDIIRYHVSSPRNRCVILCWNRREKYI